MTRILNFKTGILKPVPLDRVALWNGLKMNAGALSRRGVAKIPLESILS